MCYNDIHTPNKRHFTMLFHYVPLYLRRFFFINLCHFQGSTMFFFPWWPCRQSKIVHWCESSLNRHVWVLMHLVMFSSLRIKFYSMNWISYTEESPTECSLIRVSVAKNRQVCIELKTRLNFSSNLLIRI